MNAMENDPFELFPSGPREDLRSLRIYLMDQRREVTIRRPKNYTLDQVLATMGYLGEQYPKGTLTTGDGLTDLSVRMSVENFCVNWAGYARLYPQRRGDPDPPPLARGGSEDHEDIHSACSQSSPDD